MAIHNQGQRYSLLHWNGRIWSRSVAEVYESTLIPRFVQFLKGGGTWREGVNWETVHRTRGLALPLLLPTGAHVVLTFFFIFGGFTTGVLLAFSTGRYFAEHAAMLVYVFAVLFAPPLAMLGQYLARRIPSACAHCGEVTINLQTGRFAYLCTECGHLNITRWGIHRGPMAP